MSICNNIAPLLMCLYSYIFLGETLRSYIKETVTIAFIGCSVIAYGNYLQGQANSGFMISIPALAWIAVFLNTNQMAASTIVVRKMRDVHFMTLNIYLNIVLVVLLFGLMCFQNIEVIASLQKLDANSWFLINIIAWTEISKISLNLMALRFQNPGALAPYVYTSTLYGLAYDLFVFHITYNTITWLGISFVITANVYHVYMMISERYG